MALICATKDMHPQGQDKIITNHLPAMATSHVLLTIGSEPVVGNTHHRGSLGSKRWAHHLAINIKIHRSSIHVQGLHIWNLASICLLSMLMHNTNKGALANDYLIHDNTDTNASSTTPELI